MKIPSTLKDFEELRNKGVRLKASGRMNQRCGLFISGMSFRVVGVFEKTDEVFLEPLPEKFKDELQLLPMSLYNLEWDVVEVFDLPNKEATV